MQSTLRLEATVLPGHRLELTDPGLPKDAAPHCVSMLEFLESLPPGPVLFKTSEEANRYIQEERDSWER